MTQAIRNWLWSVGRTAALACCVSTPVGYAIFATPAFAALDDDPLSLAAETVLSGVASPDVAAIASRLTVDDNRIAERRVDLEGLRRFYAARGFAPLWLKPAGADGAPFISAAASTLRALDDAAKEGLVPAAYHVDALNALATGGAGAEDRTADNRMTVELLLTDGLLRYARDVRAGRTAPRRISRDIQVSPPSVNAADAVGRAAESDHPAAVLAALAPGNPAYRGLRDALATLRRVEKAGGWGQVPALKGKTKLEPGGSDPAVPALRDRLAASGDYHGARGKSQVYDAPLRAAVVRFQTRHGLEPNGVVGPGLLAEINVPADARIAQIEANMERARWLPDDLGARHVWVNAPEFKLTAVDGGAPVFSMKVVVGTKQRRTPVLVSSISSVVLNPTWTMPPRLAKEDYLPKLQKNPGYLAENGFSVYPNWSAGAKPLDVRKINWKAMSPAAMSHLKLRQDPGPKNALGQIKFNIANDFDVYLHDTPSRDKFARSMRALSSGCVRLAEPMTLANFVFADMPEWGAEQRKTALDSQKTKYITLNQSIPVYILYQTAWVGSDGALHFRPDIYERDAETLTTLAKSAPAAGAIRTAMNPR